MLNMKISPTFRAEDINVLATDCYGTIVEVFTEDTPPSHRVWSILSHYMRYHGYDYTPEMVCELFFDGKKKEKGKGFAYAKKLGAEGEPFDIQERNVFMAMMPGADDITVQTAAEIFRAASTKSLQLYPGVMDCLTDLKKNGTKICLMSNAQTIFTIPELNALGLTEKFDLMNISSETFFKKPSKMFFQILIDQLGIEPEHILMVGNHPGDDIKTAHKLGIRTCFINSNQSPKDDVPPPEDDIYDIYLDGRKEAEAGRRPWEIIHRILLPDSCGGYT